ncbi:MAG: class I SAM-dependent methyltransferase [Candidatus Aenigmarchaeota archaeon]|nr:class I SAM-dependent methyltransferase [Candidatus Aenigmarchaeota archaeon]
MIKSGRLKVIGELIGEKPKRNSSLSIGSKYVDFNTINLDVKHSPGLDIIADARHLPFKQDSFELILFTDVIEHLPEDEEDNALKEIHRTLRSNGRVILSTPNDRFLFKYLDPSFWLIKHRHYKNHDIRKFLENNNFKIESIFTSGGWWACAGNLWHCVITYPLNRILNRKIMPSLIEKMENKEYNFQKNDNGYTIYVKAIK